MLHLAVMGREHLDSDAFLATGIHYARMCYLMTYLARQRTENMLFGPVAASISNAISRMLVKSLLAA